MCFYFNFNLNPTKSLDIDIFKLNFFFHSHCSCWLVEICFLVTFHVSTVLTYGSLIDNYSLINAFVQQFYIKCYIQTNKFPYLLIFTMFTGSQTIVGRKGSFWSKLKLLGILVPFNCVVNSKIP